MYTNQIDFKVRPTERQDLLGVPSEAIFLLFRRRLPKTATVTVTCPRWVTKMTSEWSSEDVMFLPKGSCEGWGAKYGCRARAMRMLLGVLPKLPSEELSRITALDTPSSLPRFLPNRLLGGFRNNCRRQTKCQKACGISSR